MRPPHDANDVDFVLRHRRKPPRLLLHDARRPPHPRPGNVQRGAPWRREHVTTRIAGTVSSNTSAVRTGPDTVGRSQFTFTVGADLAVPIGQRFHLLMPVRVTPGLDTPGDGLRGLDLRAGVGLTFTIVRQPL
jgi:hypothetical protein